MKKIISIIIMAFLTIFITSCGGKSVNASKWSEMEQIKNINQEVLESNEISIDTSVGNIEIKPSQDNYIDIQAIIKIKGDNEKQKKELMDNIEVTLSKEGEKLILKVYPKNQEEEELWKWKAKKYDPMDLNINFVIKVPQYILLFNLHSGVGDISVSDITGSIEANSGVGNIELDNIVFIKKSIMKAGTGNAEVGVKNLSNAEEISIETGVGDIHINIPQDSSYDIDTKAFMEEAINDTVNGGGALIKAKASMGRVSINE